MIQKLKMGKKSIEQLKKRIKQANKANEAPETEKPKGEPHPEFGQFLSLIFENNFFTPPSEAGWVVENLGAKIRSFASLLETLRRNENYKFYLDEIFTAYRFLRGFPGVSKNDLFLCLTIALMAQADSEETAELVTADALNSPYFEEISSKIPEIFSIENNFVAQRILEIFRKNDEMTPAGPGLTQLVLNLAKSASNKLLILRSIPIKNRVADGVFFGRVLFGLKDTDLPTNDEPILKKLNSLGWLANRSCRRQALRLLSTSYNRIEGEPAFLDPTTQLYKDLASTLYMNKPSHHLYEDPELNDAFKTFWNKWGSSNVKTTIQENLEEIRVKYLRLFHHSLEDVLANPDSAEIQADNALFQRCLFMSILDLETRIDPNSKAVNVAEILQFLQTALTLNTKQVNLDYSLPKVKAILFKLIYRPGFADHDGKLDEILREIIRVCSAGGVDPKTKLIRDFAVEFSQEKNGFKFAPAVLKFWENKPEETPPFVLILAHENLNPGDPNKENLEQVLANFLGPMDEVSERVLHNVTPYNDYPKFRQFIANLVITNASVIGPQLGEEEKAPRVQRLLDFCLTEIQTLADQLTPEDKESWAGIAAIEQYLVSKKSDSPDRDAPEAQEEGIKE